MARRNLTALAVGALCTLLCTAAPAAAYRVDAKTQEITLSSLADFDKCETDSGNSGSSTCFEALKRYVKTHQKDAFEAGKRVRLHFTHWAALEFFAPALGKKPKKEQCTDSDLKAAVVSGIGLPSDYPAAELAKKIVRDACWEELQAPVSAELKGSSGYVHDNLCPLLAEKGVAAPACQPVVEKPKAAAPSALANLKGVDWKKLSLDTESSMALRSGMGEELMFVRAKPGPHPFVLLKFKSVRGPWNGQVLLAVERNGGTGKDYVIAADGKEWVALTERGGQYQAYPKGVADGLWMSPLPPNKEPAKSPTRQEIANEFAAASKPAK
jgi:hypothetical protein